MPTGDGPLADSTVTAGGTLDGPATRAVLDLADRAARADGVAPLSEHGLLRVRYGGSPGTLHLTVRHAGRLAGYAQLEPADLADPAAGHAGELVIDPELRGRGLGRALTAALAERAGTTGPLRVWAHGDLPAAGRLAEATGFARSRTLLQLRRPLAAPLAEPRLPDGIALRAFRPGQDEDAWTALNAAAFAEHPEQGSWTRADLELREREAWFDPDGFFLAERDGRLAGLFTWTKVHPAAAPGAGPVGEVYVVGVDPAERGTGLGRALTLTGLRYLRDRGLETVLLYVDEDNVPAVRMYEALGFTRWSADVMFSRQGRTG